MKIRIDRGINSSFLVIEESDRNDAADNSYEYGILSDNKFDVFVPLSERYENSITEIVYDITSMISLKELSERSPLNYEELCILVNRLGESQKAIEEYLLTPEGIILNPDYIFYDTYKKSIRFCFYPDYSKDVFLSYTELTEYLLLAIEYEEEDTVELAYKIYASVLNKDYQFEKYIDKERIESLSDEKRKNSNNVLTNKTDNEANNEANNEQNNKLNNEPNNISSSEDASKYSSEETDEEIKIKSRISLLSIGCIIALLIIGTILVTTFAVNKRLFYNYLGHKRNLTSGVLAITILICIPLINILNNKRR